MIRTKDNYIGRKLRITSIRSQTGVYANLPPGSHHRVISAPGITKNSPLGVWVMGVGEPAYIMNTEYTFITRT
jgi:hypothetical protein